MAEARLLTVREVARRVHRTEETIRRWVWSGKLPARKLGNQWFVDAAALDSLHAERRVSEKRVRYRPRGSKRAEFGWRISKATRRLFEKYDYSPLQEELRELRGQYLPSNEEILRHIEEDEALQDQLLKEYGPVDAAALVHHVRGE